MERIELRIPEEIKDIWRKSLKDLGYLEGRGMTDLIIDSVNERLLQNQDSVKDEQDRKLLQLRQREIKRLKIRRLTKQHRSAAFLVQRYVKILQKYLSQGSFIDHEDLLEDLKLTIDEAKTYPEPRRILLGLLPELRNVEYEPGISLLERELLNLGVKKSELDKNYNSNSLKQWLRKIRVAKSLTKSE